MVIMVAIIALVLRLLGMNNNAATDVVVIPPMPIAAPTAIATDDDEDWYLYNQEAYYDYVSQFTELFNSYEVRITNGRTLIRSGYRGSFKFAKGI